MLEIGIFESAEIAAARLDVCFQDLFTRSFLVDGCKGQRVVVGPHSELLWIVSLKTV